MHTRTWNLKAALGPKPFQVNQQYRHTNVNQHVLAEEVPDITNKTQTSSLRSQLSNHVQSAASPQSAGLLACLIGRCCSCFCSWFVLVSVLGLYLFLCSLAARFCFV